VHEGSVLTSSVLLACLPALRACCGASGMRLRGPVECTIVICRVALLQGVPVAEAPLPPHTFQQMVDATSSTSWHGPSVRAAAALRALHSSLLHMLPILHTLHLSCTAGYHAVHEAPASWAFVSLN
jgi:hypothetical protein